MFNINVQINGTNLNVYSVFLDLLFVSSTAAVQDRYWTPFLIAVWMLESQWIHQPQFQVTHVTTCAEILFQNSDCMGYETPCINHYTCIQQFLKSYDFIFCFAVPTSVSTFSSSVAATVTSPFLTSTVTTSTPSVTTNEQGSMTSPVAAAVTVPLLLLLFVSVAVILVLLWLKRRRMMKAANRSIPLEILSW